MFSKVSVRLGLVFGVIIFLTAALGYFSQGRLINQLLLKGIRQEMSRELDLNRMLLEQMPPGWLNAGAPDRWADRTGRILDLRVTLTDPSGRVIGDSYIAPSALASLENHRNRPEILQALETGSGEHIRYSDTVRENMLYMAVPLGKPQVYAVLRFAKPVRDIGALETEVRKGIEAGLFWALLFSLLAGVMTAFFLAKSLERLASVAEKRVHGDFSGVIPVHRNDEIGKLARGINYLSEEIVRNRRQEEWYRAVFSGIREAIIVTNASGEIILVNPVASRLFRIENAMQAFRPLRTLSDGRLQEIINGVHEESRALLKEEVTLSTAKGIRIMQISTMPVMKEGRSEGTVFVFNDITRLRNLERIRRDFVSSVSHELRTPLTSIRGYTETLLEGAMHDPEHAAAFLQIILKESEQLTALVNDVLDLSSIESGRIRYNFAPVDLCRVVERSIDLLRPAMEKKQIRLECNFPEVPLEVCGDVSYLDIVVRNLLDNAVKYVDDRNGRIRISVFRSGNNDVTLEIDDNGIGIASADLDRIFERFYRVDKARSRQLGGTGLGLSIVKHIVLAHKGRVAVRSRLNQGSVFSVTLPVSGKEQR
ncbi:MAG: HAMP domain-containing protein [Chlorobi bacterium]|nr:HAMP domain-containing protein [Chlorobiota bacterium]